MRGNQLGALIIMLRRELGLAESPALGRNVRDQHQQVLSAAQERLFQAYDWPFKQISRDVLGQHGQRYYAPPTGLDFENIRSVDVMWATTWQCCERGIGIEQYNEVNSDAGILQDYVRRWQFYNDPDDNGDMIEFWPVPLTNDASRVRFNGQKKLAPLVMDADKCEVDDLAIVLSAAADLSNQKDRGPRQAKADRHIFSLVKNLSNKRTFVSGGGCDPSTEQYRPPQVVISQ